MTMVYRLINKLIDYILTLCADLYNSFNTTINFKGRELFLVPLGKINSIIQ